MYNAGTMSSEDKSTLALYMLLFGTGFTCINAGITLSQGDHPFAGDILMIVGMVIVSFGGAATMAKK